MEIEIRDVTDDNFDDIPPLPGFDCRSCLYWESPHDFERKIPEKQAMAKKRKWFASMARTFGSCGKIIYLDKKPVGFAEFGLPSALPSLEGYPTGPPNQEAVYIACIVIRPEARHRGLATKMLRGVIEDLRRRGVKTLEVFAGKGFQEYPPGPAQLYQKLGFEIVRDDERYPLMRLKL